MSASGPSRHPEAARNVNFRVLLDHLDLGEALNLDGGAGDRLGKVGSPWSAPCRLRDFHRR